MSSDKCPHCGEDWWVSGPRWGAEVCHECGADKPLKNEDEEETSSPR